MRRQVYTDLPRTLGESNRQNPKVVTTGHIWAGKDQIGWIKNGSVFSVATQLRFATLDDDGNLYSLDGHSLNLHLETVNGGGRIAVESHSHAVESFNRLAGRS